MINSFMKKKIKNKQNTRIKNKKKKVQFFINNH